MGQRGNENAAAYRGFISCPVWSRRDGEAEVTQRITPGYLDWEGAVSRRPWQGPEHPGTPPQGVYAQGPLDSIS